MSLLPVPVHELTCKLLFSEVLAFSRDRNGIERALNPAGEAIMMVPEPENEFDEHAIAIKKLDGQQLGYVPRDINQKAVFHGGLLFGHIRSMGPTYSAEPSLYGARVKPVASKSETLNRTANHWKCVPIALTYLWEE